MKMFDRLLSRMGYVRVEELQRLDHQITDVEFERDDLRSRLAQQERAFTYQSMAFSRRYEALEKTVLDVAFLSPVPPIILDRTSSCAKRFAL